MSEALSEALSMGVGSSSRRDEALERRDWSSMVAVVVVLVAVHRSSPRVCGCGVRVRVQCMCTCVNC